MTPRRALLGLVLSSVAAIDGATAQLRPVAGPGDPRIQSVPYDANQVVQLQVASGFQLSVEFGPDERIENVAVGDSAAWQVTPNKRGDHLFVKPVAAGVTTNLTVITDARSYNFELSPLYGAMGNTAYTVRFTYPETALATLQAMPPSIPALEDGLYKLRGAKALLPEAISDDGTKTFIEFPADRPLPAIFAYDEHGREVLVEGAMRAGQYVIDGVKPKLLFRIDKRTATATRVLDRK
ncbi:TrbG/VirB9 family P-type conjugative transfer protein [Sphingomonas sp. PB4P5]|uniref:TrbG/VirB9 family P-type conjugative transfer protein n=1 Tax=Parasphingomonas puruogangriensis TaxID=3096155 RepID=UPI002FCC8C26